MDIRISSFNFPSTEGTGPQTASAQLSFPREVRHVAVGITGYSATFQNEEDHHLGRLTVELSASVDASDATKVNVSGTFGLRDWSNEWDDAYSGIVEYALFAHLIDATPPAPGDPRGDLVIVDAEITQAIQHFRSHQHLDSANVFPDNSIRLVADKPTAVRLYVDYDANSGLERIRRLSGELAVTSGGVTTTIPPLRRVVPRRDSTIDRGQRDHTVNFVIPEGLCRGTVEISARVFSDDDDTQMSRDYVKTLTFETMPSLPVMAVGIEYAGDDVSDPSALSAPTMSDFVDVLELTEALFPIPAVAITSYVTMTYDDDVKSDIAEGCDKLGDLRDAVADLRGDSDDIVYGLFNSGLDTGSVGGCGGGGSAVGPIRGRGTAAHEIGHALGRKHAPCDNVTRCAEPVDTDGNYPHYVGYDSDSIGEYGFDTRASFGMVSSPGSFHDVMGYSDNRWISPYTYKALMSRIPESYGAAAFASRMAVTARLSPAAENPWIAIKQPRLFLRLDIHRNRRVDFHPAFHFDARPRPHGHDPTGFSVELLDAEGRVLRGACLFGDAAGCGSCGGNKWPLKIRQAVPFHPEGRQLVLLERDQEVTRWTIGDPPKVTVEVADVGDEPRSELEVSWQASAGSNDASALWYLVQWRDRVGTWRGVAPRTQQTSIRIPKRLFHRVPSLAVRVLASSGIATGVGQWERPNGPPQPAGGGTALVPVGVDVLTWGAHELPGVLRVVLQRADGSTAPSTLRWYDSRGAELGRGRSFDPQRLPVGQHQITVVAPDEQGVSTTWLLERTPGGKVMLLIGDQKPRLSPRQHDGCRDTDTED